jgi:glutathione peroxidase
MRSSRLALAGAALGLAIAVALAAAADHHENEETEATSVLGFTLARIDGTPQPLSDYRGQVVLLVNVASKCGFTPQYEGLEALYERYRERGFAVLGFPSNDFGGQEPGTNAQIADFCRSTYGVEFPMFAKIKVKGEGTHPLYQHLTSLPAPIGGEVEWNFQKYLLNRRGEVVAKFSPDTKPQDAELVGKLEVLLGEDS